MAMLPYHKMRTSHENSQHSLQGMNTVYFPNCYAKENMTWKIPGMILGDMNQTFRERRVPWKEFVVV